MLFRSNCNLLGVTFMKKIVIFCLIFVFLSFYGCTPITGTVKDVQVKNVKSDIYSEDDINEAIEVIEDYFVKNFNGCSLKKIAYAGDEITKLESQYQSEHSDSNKDVIVLTSDFYVYPKCGDRSLNTDSTYTGWKWILVRMPNGKWEHKDHGYG